MRHLPGYRRRLRTASGAVMYACARGLATPKLARDFASEGGRDGRMVDGGGLEKPL